MPAQIYLVSPPQIEAPEALADRLTRLCTAAPVAAFRLALPQASADQLHAVAGLLFSAVQASGTAAILAGDPELAAATGADGVHLSDPATVAAARHRLGPEISIGVACGTMRHDAMVAAEAGADYVEFGPFDPLAPTPADPGLLTWWQELMELPCVAGPAIALDHAPALVAAGADFLAVGGFFWTLEADAQARVLADFEAAAALPFAPGA